MLPSAVAAASWLHWVTAGLMLAVFLLYLVRSNALNRRTDIAQSRDARDYRLGFAVLLAAFFAGLTGRAVQRDPVEWFHLLILVAEVFTLRAQLRLGTRRDPT